MREEIDSEIKAAFDTDLADAVTKFTATRVECDPWDNSKKSMQYTGRGVLMPYRSHEIGGEVLLTDIKLIVLQSEVHVRVGDTIDGQHLVLSVKNDPAGVTHVAQLRGTA